MLSVRMLDNIREVTEKYTDFNNKTQRGFVLKDIDDFRLEVIDILLSSCEDDSKCKSCMMYRDYAGFIGLKFSEWLCVLCRSTEYGEGVDFCNFKPLMELREALVGKILSPLSENFMSDLSKYGLLNIVGYYEKHKEDMAGRLVWYKDEYGSGFLSVSEWMPF